MVDIIFIYGNIYIYMGISVDSLFDSVEPAVTPGRRGQGVAPQHPVTIMASMASAGFPHGLGEGFYRVGRG